jgi:hypothetical protein
MTPARSSAHLAFVRSLPCAILGCRSRRPVQAAHTPGSRGMSQKRSDLDTIPLCVQHHDEQHRIGWKRFIETYELDVPQLLKALQEKPRIFTKAVLLKWPWDEIIGQPHYYASYRDELFRLHPVCNGFAESVEVAVVLCREYLIEQLFTERRKHETLTDALCPGSSDCLG